MQTPRFWRSVDRLGSEDASLTLWRMELGEEFQNALPYLRRLDRMTDRIPDPDDRSRSWMQVYPSENEDTYWAESEDVPSHRTPFKVPASDLNILTPDWEAIRPALASALGFTASARTVEFREGFRQVGFAQPHSSVSVPVFLYIPPGSFSDYAHFLITLNTLPASVLYVPTNRFMVPEVFSIARERTIAIEAVADRMTQTGPATTLAVAATVERRRSKRAEEIAPILVVQPDWTWNKLRIKLTQKGTLIAKYGDARGTHQFLRTEGADGRASYSALFKILFRMSIEGRWKNPPRSHKHYAASQRNFARLRDLIKGLVRIDGDPFRKIEGAWEARFQFETDSEIAAAKDLHERRLAEMNAPSRPRHDDEEEDDF